MRTSTMIRATAMAAVLGMAASAYAVNDHFQSVADGSWADYANVFQMWNGSTWVTATRAPASGDTVDIYNTVDINTSATATTINVYSYSLSVDSSTVFGLSGTNPTISISNGASFSVLSGATLNVSSQTVTVTVTSGGTFDVDAGANAALSGSSPSLIVNGDMDLSGTVVLGSSSGVPVFTVSKSQSIPNTGGALMGLPVGGGSAAQPQFRIDPTSAAKTITNLGTIEGSILIKASNAAHNVDFVNQGTVTANVTNGNIHLDPSLHGIGDNAGAIWELAGSGAQFTFDIGSPSLAGKIRMLGASSTGQQLNINDTVVTSGQGQYEYGTVVVDFGMQLTVGSLFGGTYNGNATHTANLWSSGSPFTLNAGTYAPNP